MSQKWKAGQVADTFNAFFAQFGELKNHQNSRVVLEVILEELLHGKSEALFVSNKARSNGNEIDFGISGPSFNTSDENSGHQDA